MKSSVFGVALALLVCVALLTGAPPAGATPHSLSPANGGALAATGQAFSWLDTAAQGPVDHWYVEISVSPQVDYYPWGYFSGGLAYASGRLTTSSVNLNSLGSALSPGTYYWHVCGYYGPLGSLGTAWSSVQSFTVRSATAQAPRIAVNPTSFTFSVTEGDATWKGGELAISNTGGGTLLFTVPLFAVTWLGSAPGSQTQTVYTLPIGVRPFGGAGGTTPMGPGIYSTTITVQDAGSSPAATNSPVLVPVTMQVHAADGAAPTGASVSVKAGAAATKTAAVTLRIAASDAGSGVGEMRFRNAGDAWTVWVPFSGTKTWHLQSGDGTKTVEAQVRDKAGNVGAVVSDTIVLDTAKPTTQAPSAARVVKGRTATLKYRVLDAPPNAGTAKATIKIRTRAGKLVKTLRGVWKPVGTAQSIRFRCKLAKKTYKFFVYATDTAGNAQAKVGSNRLTVR